MKTKKRRDAYEWSFVIIGKDSETYFFVFAITTLVKYDKIGEGKTTEEIADALEEDIEIVEKLIEELSEDL